MKQKQISIVEIGRPDTFALECSIINTAMFAYEKMGELRRVIRREFFSSELNLRAWDLLTDLTSRGLAIDPATLYTQAGSDRAFQDHIVDHIMDSPYTCSDADLVKMAENLRDTYIRQVAYDKAARVLDAVAAGADIPATLADLGDTLKEVGEVLAQETMRPTDEIARDLADDIRTRAVVRTKTGIDGLDYALYGGLPSGSMVILAARPSVGKTTLALQIAQAAAKSGRKVCFYSLEMTEKELTQRLLVATGLVSPADLASGNVDWEAYDRAAQLALTPNLKVVDSITTLEDIRAGINAMARTQACDIAFIDYLGLVVHDDKYKTLSQSIGEVTKAVKLLAKECNIPIVLLCQLNRESTKEKRSPEVSDLRDSGNIEQDADIILMLERPRDGNDQELDSRIDLWLRKNRNGKRLKDPIRLQGNEYYSDFREVRDNPAYSPEPSYYEPQREREDKENEKILPF